MIIEQSRYIIKEVAKAFIGKDDIIEKVLMTIYAGGHILLEDSHLHTFLLQNLVFLESLN